MQCLPLQIVGSVHLFLAAQLRAKTVEVLGGAENVVPCVETFEPGLQLATPRIIQIGGTVGDHGVSLAEILRRPLDEGSRSWEGRPVHAG